MPGSRALRVYLSVLIATATVAFAAASQGAAGDKPFSRAELLAYLRSIPKSQDLSVPYETRKAAHDKLTALIKQRGVDFVQPKGKFDQEFHDAGISPASSIAIWENYRAPGTTSPGAGAHDAAFFAKRWAMGIAGTTTRFDRQGSNVVRKDQLVGAAGGYLEIAANLTYVWRYSRSDAEMRGRWRAATRQELQSEAGQGIVLLRGYDDGNWLVTERTSEEPGEYINVRNLAQRYRYFIGSRPAGISESTPAPIEQEQRLDVRAEQVIRASGLKAEKTGESWTVQVAGERLPAVAVALSVVGDALLMRATYKPGFSVAAAQMAAAVNQAGPPDGVSVGLIKNEVIAYAIAAIRSLEGSQVKRLVGDVARVVDGIAGRLSDASGARPAPRPPDAGPRLGRYQMLSYGNPANPLRIGHIELVAGGVYRYYNAGGRLLGTGKYAFDAASSTVIWQDGLLKEQKWTGDFTIEREGKTHKIRLMRTTIAVNNID